MSIPATATQAIEQHVHEIIKTELAKIPGIVGSLLPGLAGLLAQAALATDAVQGEAVKLADKGADFVIEESVKGLNELQAAVLSFLSAHPALKALYDALHPTLTGGQVLSLAADEAKAIMSMKMLGRVNELRAVLGLKPV